MLLWEVLSPFLCGLVGILRTFAKLVGFFNSVLLKNRLQYVMIYRKKENAHSLSSGFCTARNSCRIGDVRSEGSLKQINEFEYDWCLGALDDWKTRRKELAGSRWLISGTEFDGFQQAVLRFLTFVDRELALGLSLTILAGAEDCALAAQAFPDAAVVDLDALREPVQGEFCLYIGYTAARRGPQPSQTRRAEAFQRWVRASRRSLCVSGWGYDAFSWPVAAAEGEFRQGETDPAGAFSRQVEAWILENDEKGVILRPGVILAPGLGLDDPVTRLVDGLLRREGSLRFSYRSRYTMVYMADFLAALAVAAAAPGLRGAYNVGSEEMTLSALEICGLCCQAGAQEPVMEPENGAVCGNYALNCGKLRCAGWEPRVDAATALTLEVMARSHRQELWFPGGHDGKLEIIHRELLNILEEIDRICKKHDIPYFLAGGTLLGAARHGGFIPWDDDLDIMMLRPDHDRFLAVAQAELPAHMFLQTPKTDPGCHYLISKVRLSGTVFSSELLQRFPELHRGLFVDVIAQDYTANHGWAQKLHLKLCLLARGLVYKKWIGQPAASVRRSYAVLDGIKKLLPMAALEKFQRWALTLFNRKSDRRYLFDSMGINIKKGVYPAQWLEKQAFLPFEGKLLPVPENFDGYLTYLYGDYRRPVPVSQRRVVHSVPQLDLGEYAAGCLSNAEGKLPLSW